MECEICGHSIRDDEEGCTFCFLTRSDLTLGYLEKQAQERQRADLEAARDNMAKGRNMGHQSDTSETPKFDSTFRATTLAGLGIGALAMFAGFTMSFAGLSGSMEIILESGGLNAKLINGTPGAVFGLLGFMIVWRYKPKRSTMTVMDRPAPQPLQPAIDRGAINRLLQGMKHKMPPAFHPLDKQQQISLLIDIQNIEHYLYPQPTDSTSGGSSGTSGDSEGGRARIVHYEDAARTS